MERIGADPVAEPRPVEQLCEIGPRACELERHASELELVEQVVEHPERGRVGVTDRGRVDEDGAGRRVGLVDEAQGLVAEVGGVGEKQLVREPEDHETRDRLVLRMPVDAAEPVVLVGARLVGDAAEDRDPGPVRPPDQREQRGDDGDHDARQHPEERHGGEPDDRELGVALIDAPEPTEPADVDEPDDRRDDDRGKRACGSPSKSGRQEEHRRNEHESDD